MRQIDADALKTDVRRYVLEGTDEFGTISVEVAERSFLRLIDRQPTIEAEPEWIPVTEGLPEEWRKPDGDMVNYLIFAPEFGVDIGNYLEPAKTWLCVGIPCSVTHWKPLPEGPKEDGGADS